MKKQLVSLLMAGALSVAGAMVGGCAHQVPPATQPAAAVLAPGSFAQQWVAKIDLTELGDGLTALHVRDNVIFAYSKSQKSFMLNRSSGRLMTATQITRSEQLIRPPIILSDKVVYPTVTSLEVYDLKGKFIRTVTLPQPISSPGVGSGSNLVYIGTSQLGSARFEFVDLSNALRPVRWEFQPKGGLQAGPALYNGVLYIGCDDGRVYAVTQSQQPVWNLPDYGFQTDGPVRAEVKADDFGAYIASEDSKLYCVDKGNGKVKWQYFAGAALSASPIVTAKTVYLAVPGKGLAAIDKTTGAYNRKPKWFAADVVQILSEDDRNVYVRTKDNSILALDRTTGDERFRGSRSDLSVFGTNLKDSTIFAATANGEILAVRPVLKPGSVGVMVLEDVTRAKIDVVAAAQ